MRALQRTALGLEGGALTQNSPRDFVFCLASIRMRSYAILPPLDRLNALRIVGNSIPAVATSTAVAAGLACIELYRHTTINIKTDFPH